MLNQFDTPLNVVNAYSFIRMQSLFYTNKETIIVLDISFTQFKTLNQRQYNVENSTFEIETLYQR